MAVVTLLTDFGLDDTYVGQVKGAILSVAPDATLVDLTHAVPAQDVQAGAFLLWSAVEPFPAGTVHVAVVDPGVGSARRAIAIRSARGMCSSGLTTACCCRRSSGWAAARSPWR